MLFIINNKIVEGIKVNQDGIPAIPKDLLIDIEDSLITNLPYVYIPSIKPYRRVECEIGYWNNLNQTKTICPIVFDNVSIISIVFYFEKVQVQEWSGGLQYGKDKYKLFYHYEISLELKDCDKKHNYVFNSDDYLEINYGHKESPKMKTMEKLFKTILPKLNEYITQGFPLDLLNRCYVQSCFPQKETDFVTNQYVHSFKWFKQILYSAKIKHTQGAFFLELGEGQMPLVNHHVAEVISGILGVRFLRESDDRYIYGIVTGLLKEIDNNESLLMPYCLAKLFYNAENLYSSEIANKEIMFAVSSDINEPIITNKIHDLFIPTTDIVKMFDFIINLKAEHKIRGQYRAGRDDYECEYEQYSFPLKEDYAPSHKLISLINSVLNINLELKEADDSIFNPQPRQYIFTDVINSGYVAWLARDEDWGSAELQNSSLNKIFDKIYHMYKYDDNAFYNLL